jgi:hypothetical protein
VHGYEFKRRGSRTLVPAVWVTLATLTFERSTMKKLHVTIQLEMSVPDTWELVETSEGTPVVKLPDGQFMDIAIEPLFATNPEETWSSTEDEDVLNDILDMVESEAVAYEFVTH